MGDDDGAGGCDKFKGRIEGNYVYFLSLLAKIAII